MARRRRLFLKDRLRVKLIGSLAAGGSVAAPPLGLPQWS